MATLLQMVDVRAALAFVADLAECDDGGQLNVLVAVLAGLIGADAALVTGCRAWATDLWIEAGDAGVYTPDLLGAAGRCWREHPVMTSDVMGAAVGARRVSDFVALRQWRRGELFNDFYRPLGARHEISAQLTWDPSGSSCCVALHRSGRDFGDRELALLELLAPHLAVARERVAAGPAIGEVGPSGLVESPGEAESPASVRAPREPAPGALAARLPITPRESEVLALLAAGRTNDGIAADLDISPNTVARHVEHVYAKLGVHTRVAAARAALDAVVE